MLLPRLSRHSLQDWIPSKSLQWIAIALVSLPLTVQAATITTPATTTTEVPATQVLMKNVDFYVDPEIALHIRVLQGNMRSKTSGPVVFDDKHAFVLHINSGEVGLDARGLSALMNKYIFGYKGAPIHDARVSIGNGLMRMTGKMHKGIDLPFDITAQVSITPDGMMRIHPVQTRILKLNGDALMRAFGLSLQKLLDVSKAVGVTVQKDDIIIDPTKVLPPPTIEGRVTAIRVDGDEIVQTFGVAERQLLTPPDAAAKNFMYFRGGSLRFGRLTMSDAEMQIIDLDPSDPFKFNLDLYAKQLVAGYSRTLPDMGLKVYMPDIDKVGQPRPTPRR